MSQLKYLFFLLFSILIIFCGAQVSPRKAVIYGKEYFVYPYTFKVSNEGVNGEYLSVYDDEQTCEIVPYPGNLPDGEYVMYHAPKYDSYKKIYYDSTRVAGTFNLKQNKKNGKAYFLSEYNSELEYGNYVDDQKQGYWINPGYESYDDPDYYKDPSHKRKRWVRKLIAKGIYPSHRIYLRVHQKTYYDKGIRTGPYKIVAEKDSNLIFATGQYKDNQPTGHWEIFHSIGKLYQSFTYADTEDAKRADRLLNIYHEEYDRISDWERYIEPEYGPYNGWFLEYHENGNLNNRRYFRKGYCECLDTSYYYDGKINKIFIREKTADGKELLKFRVYDFYSGNSALEAEYLDREFIHGVNFYNGRKSSEEFTVNYYKNIANRDTLVPTYIYYSYDRKQKEKNSIIISTTYLHLETGTRWTVEVGEEEFIIKKDIISGVFKTEKREYLGNKEKFEVVTYASYFPIGEGDTTYYDQTIDSVRLLVNGKPYSGEFVYRNGDYRYARDEKVKLKKNKIIYLVDDYYGRWTGIPFQSEFYNPVIPNSRNYFGRRWTSTKLSSYLNFTNGVLDGEMKILNGKHGRPWDINHYKMGIMHGEQISYAADKLDKYEDLEIHDESISKKAKLFRKWRYYLSQKSNVLDGKLDGTQLTYHYNGRLESTMNFSNGIPHGRWEEYSLNGKIRTRADYSNGNIHGKYETWYTNNKPMYDLTYNHGYLTGEYKYFYQSGNLQRYGKAEDDLRIGEWTRYFEEGMPKYVETFQLKDSVPAEIEDEPYTKVINNPILSINPLKSCSSKQYYPTGTLAAEGEIVKGARTGIWNFYDEGGNLIRKIDYKLAYDVFKNEKGKNDTIHHYGYYESRYQNGTKESEAFILNESYQYDCYQQTALAHQDLYYLNFWKSDGTQTLKERTGRISTTHLSTGKTESEGEMINGKQEGYWRFWDADGKLNKVGNYIDGKEDGVWMMGDLEGFHYLDDACFDMNDAMAIKKMEYDKKVLDLYIVHYRKGEIIRQNAFNVNLNTKENQMD